MSQPMPRSLLIHSVVYEEKDGTDDWGSVQYKYPRTITNVRVDHGNSLIESSVGEREELKAVLYHDEVHSTPCDYTIGSKVRWAGFEYVVMGTDLLFDEQKLHHKEVRLA